MMDNLPHSQKSLPYLLALHSVDGLGPVRLKKILDYFGDSKSAWEASLKELRTLGIPQSVLERLQQLRKSLIPEEYAERILKSNTKVLTIFDKRYPELLKQIYDPPIVIFYRGEILPQDNFALGIVGTRRVTGYGKTVTAQLSTEISQRGFTIISGLARGVDTVAHNSAIEAGGRTLAVLGGGLNKIFPPENYKLVDKISSGFGAVLSEYPPDHPALSGNFPSRNRIIAGLSKAVLVTEAAEDSGSLITARIALEEGREVFAVPGPITSSLSKGPAELIKEGAKLVFNTNDILDQLGLDRVKPQPKTEVKLGLGEVELLILTCLENETMHIDEISRQLKKPVAEVSGALIRLEILGVIKGLGGGNYVKSM
ncbi:DNA-protecting protein DprA [Candidatus Daviesbacteria bacterium]|nr:DNA-protecting protein DprA [Candidatus Daviesbacteria bacterium]